jgi:hypothetical protein
VARGQPAGLQAIRGSEHAYRDRDAQQDDRRSGARQLPPVQAGDGRDVGRFVQDNGDEAGSQYDQRVVDEVQ